MPNDHIPEGCPSCGALPCDWVDRPGWRPIETAPKDGTTIDVWRDGSRETVYWGFPPHECGETGQYCDSDWHSIKKPGWICSTFGEFVGGKHDPFTHWLPIPPAPESQDGGEG